MMGAGVSVLHVRLLRKPCLVLRSPSFRRLAVEVFGEIKRIEANQVSVFCDELPLRCKFVSDWHQTIGTKLAISVGMVVTSLFRDELRIIGTLSSACDAQFLQQAERRRQSSLS